MFDGTHQTVKVLMKRSVLSSRRSFFNYIGTVDGNHQCIRLIWIRVMTIIVNKKREITEKYDENKEWKWQSCRICGTDQ